MLRFTFILAVVAAVAGGLVAGSPGQRVAALLVVGAVLGHRAVLARLAPAHPVRYAVESTAPAAGALAPADGGRLDR